MQDLLKAGQKKKINLIKKDNTLVLKKMQKQQYKLKNNLIEKTNQKGLVVIKKKKQSSGSYQNKRLNRSNSQKKLPKIVKAHRGKGSEGDFVHNEKLKKNVKNMILMAIQEKNMLVSPKKPQQTQKSPRAELKDSGFVLNIPQFDNIMFSNFQILEEGLQKYLQMINNDNDIHYILNAFPELRDLRKKESETKDFLTGRISKFSILFEHITGENIANILKKVPNYYRGYAGKNIKVLKITLMTKFKVVFDLGLVQFSYDGAKLTIFRIYISRIYRKINLTAFVYLQMFKSLLENQYQADKLSCFVLQKNVNAHKFFKFIGFKIQKIATEARNKSIQYFQQFTMKRQQLQAAIKMFYKTHKKI